MGSKGLKTLVISRKGRVLCELSDSIGFKTASKKFAKAVRDDEGTEVLSAYGTASALGPINAIGAYSTCNAKYGRFEQADNKGKQPTRDVPSVSSIVPMCLWIKKANM